MRRPVRHAGADRQHGIPQPGIGERHRPVRAEALPIPVVRLAPDHRGDCTRRRSPACSTRPTACTTTCRASRRPRPSAGSRPTTARTPTTPSATGNNLSGGFSDPNTANPPTNYTGGLYASDLFLRALHPPDRAVAAFKDGGLIDVTFDEAFPAFTFTGNSFNNSTDTPATAASSIASDSAAETIFGHGYHYQPTGPNTPLATDAGGNQLMPGPGDNAFVDRPSTCVAQTTPPEPAGTCLLGGGSHSPGASHRRDGECARRILDHRRQRCRGHRRRAFRDGCGVPSGAFVGPVTDTPAVPTVPSQSHGVADTGSFELVDGSGHPLLTTAAVSGVTLGAETAATDPLFDATDPTTGGGDTGSVLISPFIRPGSVSTVDYNHYSWLRTMEDIFDVDKASPGLDGHGHIGYAAQVGLAPFGADVFNNPTGPGDGEHGHGLDLLGLHLSLGGFGLGGVMALGGLSRRRQTRPAARS